MKGRTPQERLISVFSDGYLEEAELLLKDYDLKSDGGCLLLVAAEACGDYIEGVTMLLEHGALIQGYNGRTALHSAISRNRLDLVKLLLERGAYVDLPQEGQTPISKAAELCQLEIVQELLKYGADLTIQDSDYYDENHYSPLFRAIITGNAELVKILMDGGASTQAISIVNHGEGKPRMKRTPLTFAVTQGKLDAVKVMLKYDINVNVADEFGATPLYYAASLGNVELVKELLANGASVQVKPRHRPALYGATVCGHLEVVKLLLQQEGIDVNAKHNHLTPLANAAHSCHTNNIEIVKVLIEHGAMLDTSSESLYQILCHYCNVDMVELLVRNFPEVAKQAGAAFVVCARLKNEKSYTLMNLLIQRGVNINYSRSTDPVRTALHEAVLARNVKTVWLLTVHGADTSLLCPTSTTPKTIWQMCEGDALIHEALLHFWTPQTHKYHPRWTQEAIICVLLVSKKQNWQFDQAVLYKILSYVAYDWFKPPAMNL